MPLLSIETNQSLDQAQTQSLLAAASAKTAEILGKPESYVMVKFNSNTDMMFAGNQQPLAYVELKSLGLPEDRTAGFSAALCVIPPLLPTKIPTARTINMGIII